MNYLRLSALLICASLLSFCTSDLKEFQGEVDKGAILNIEGDFCADKPSDIELPVKILFVVDKSGSLWGGPSQPLLGTDPDYCLDSNGVAHDWVLDAPSCPPDSGGGIMRRTNLRQEAVRQVWERYYLNEAYHFGLVQFGDGATPEVDGDWVQGDDFEPYIPRIISNEFSGIQTNIYEGLRQARTIIRHDILQTPENLRDTLRYVVILFTDGVPDDGTGSYDPDDLNAPDIINKESIVGMAETITNLETLGAGDVTVNTAFLRRDTMNLTFVNNATDLLDEIASVGNGIPAIYNPDTPNPGEFGEVSFLNYDLTSFIRTFTVKSFVAYNKSSLVDTRGSVLADSDADGLSDADDNRVIGYASSFLGNSDLGILPDPSEEALGFDINNPVDDSLYVDSDGDSCPDILERRTGSNTLAVDCDITTFADTDADTCPDELEDAIEATFATVREALEENYGITLPDATTGDDCLLPNDTNTPSLFDTDLDGCPDALETAFFPPVVVGTPPEEDPSNCNIRMFLDTDNDGCSDAIETSIGLNQLNGSDCSPSILRDSDGDGIGDGVEVSVGKDPLNPIDNECVTSKDRDTDSDGLKDCEEDLVGSLATLFDSDKDGLTDFIELHGGSYPTSETDIYEDTDLDGFTNNIEVREHTNPFYSDGGERGQISYKYSLTNLGESLDKTFCYNFSVKNITLQLTKPDALGREGINRVLFYILETSKDADFTKMQGTMRVKEFVIRYERGGDKYLIEEDGSESFVGSTIVLQDEDIKEFTLIQ